MQLLSIKYLAISFSILFLSCAKEAPELNLNNLFDEESGIDTELYRLENFTYKDYGFPYYEVYADVVVFWDKLEKFTKIDKCKFYFEGLGYSIHSKGENPLKIRRFLNKGETYCTSISFLNGEDESYQIQGDCIDVPQ